MRLMAAGFDRGLALLALVLLVALLGIVTLGVVTRAMNDPLIWTDEVSRFVMVWLSCVGWLMASRHGAHIRIRFFVDKLPRLPTGLVEGVLQGAVALFGGLVARYGWTLVLRNMELEATTVPVPMAVLYVPVAIAGAMTCLQGLGELVGTLRGLGRAA